MSTSFNRILSPVGTTIFTHMICCLFYCWNITFEMLLHDLSSSFFFTWMKALIICLTVFCVQALSVTKIFLMKHYCSLGVNAESFSKQYLHWYLSLLLNLPLMSIDFPVMDWSMKVPEYRGWNKANFRIMRGL